MLTIESTITDAPSLLGLVVVEAADPPELVATGVTVGILSVITCVTAASESPMSFLADSHSLIIMGVCSGLITFPD